MNTEWIYGRVFLEFRDNYTRMLDAPPNLHCTMEDTFKKFLISNLEGPSIEVPVALRLVSEPLLYTGDKIKNVVIPIPHISIFTSSKTSSGIFKDILQDNTRCLRKVITRSNDMYYGKKGIILDSELSPLVFMTMVQTLAEERNEGDITKYIYNYDAVKIYIHPKVFNNPTKLIPKTIIGDLIPYYLNNKVRITDYYNEMRMISLKPQVIIEDISPKFIFNSTATINEHINDDLNKLLVDNVNDIINING